MPHLTSAHFRVVPNFSSVCLT